MWTFLSNQDSHIDRDVNFDLSAFELVQQRIGMVMIRRTTSNILAAYVQKVLLRYWWNAELGDKLVLKNEARKF